MRRHRAVDAAFELLDLPAREVLEPGADPLHGFGLFPLRLLGQLALPASHPALELVQRPAPVGGMRFELVAHEAEGIVERPAELSAEPRHAGSLLLALGRQPLGVRRQAQLDLAQQLLLPLLELGDSQLRRLGDPIEIL